MAGTWKLGLAKASILQNWSNHQPRAETAHVVSPKVDIHLAASDVSAKPQESHADPSPSTTGAVIAFHACILVGRGSGLSAQLGVALSLDGPLVVISERPRLKNGNRQQCHDLSGVPICNKQSGGFGVPPAVCPMASGLIFAPSRN